MEIKRTISNKIVFVLLAVILATFLMGWILPVGIDKVSSLTYREYLFSTYTVFTQFGFLMFAFLVAFFINKEYSGKTILFYRMMKDNSFTFYCKKVLTLVVETLGIIFSILLIISAVFKDFSVFLQMFFLFSMVAIQYILIVALISLLMANILLSIGFSLLYWIITVVFVSIGGLLRFFAIFDASNDLYGKVGAFLESSDAFLGIEDNLTVFLYILAIAIIAMVVAKLNNNRWLELGTR
ncbi:peptide ABC transporter permease [Candidatus Enterococcus ikei]|uniref:Peptide ABC transporter permease n=1 Tax=Candidatus Enterococcus ikei TaxID=2815326 RepID=A0ABS3H2F5_9ENTE|nr:peptide ABC transporter permease [Enterococcus sp. DIV0869a]MBO0441215.1 peptide ABC transporter permease [Enterococcus sp. DIV0869a]